ncbi:MAG: acyltransferase [Bacteroidaceae bacterium]|nr:acyltransferase [Bacteroidaceae bacterium]
MFTDSKPHYLILDGLRGVAALVVILFHVFECFDWSPAPKGYLAVDFFFVLSGFVIGYAYDNRWGRDLTTGGFFRRRLIRLHPMVVAGAVVGAVCFMLQGAVQWDGTSVATSMVMLALLAGMFLVPLSAGAAADVRGNGEMFPLNGPSWSLFFEYVGNVLYALLLRRLPTRWLGALAVVTGGMLVHVAWCNGGLVAGWTMADGGFWGGLVRMLFPYTVGMWMARCFRPMKLRGTFWWCGLCVVVVACLPLLLGEQTGVAGVAYDLLCVMVVFPLLVWTGASELHVGPGTRRVSRFLGELSYPLYAIHYPFMYLFYAKIGFDGVLVPIARLSDVWVTALLLPFFCILTAYIFLRFYDRPVRRWLSGDKPSA